MEAGTSTPELVPVRVLNEHVYCPRLAHLEWVGSGFVDNDDTIEGAYAHRRVDRDSGGEDGEDGEDGEPPPVSTALSLSSERLGLIAKLDMVEVESGRARPIEYKRGGPREGDTPLWPPEKVQLCAQALLLREAGYEVEEVEVYFAGSRTRHRIALTEELERETLAALAELRKNAARAEPPPPLVDSPKCPRCSLVGLCLPDEINAIRGAAGRPRRRLMASDPASRPMYVATLGARVSKRGGRLVLRKEGELVADARLVDVSHLAVFGNVDVSAAALRALFERRAPVLWLTYGGWLSGVATGTPPGNAELRTRQHIASATGHNELAAAFVRGKILNSRTLIRRNGDESSRPAQAQLRDLANRAQGVDSSDSLLGVEGTAARIYFRQLARLLRPPKALGAFRLDERNRRPPRDRINALLSFLYSMLVKETVIAAWAAGLDPYVGFLHAPRFGRPALALDLAEEFRPLIAESVALSLVNNGSITERDFVVRGDRAALTAAGRKKVIRGFERRMEAELTHPLFGYRASYRRSLEIQARLLAAMLIGNTEEYRPLTTR